MKLFLTTETLLLYLLKDVLQIFYGVSPIIIVLLVVGLFGAVRYWRSGRNSSGKSDLFEEQSGVH